VTNPVQRTYLLYKAPIYVFGPPDGLPLVEHSAQAVFREHFEGLQPRVTFGRRNPRA
jgi:hypothetical protein